ncbi:MAG: LysR family transcriptional regulator [Gammaproteobacteria bacterium]|nr:MAG: LysR family transcriptional regulator [Gammaproteobacteria bacterium]
MPAQSLPIFNVDLKQLRIFKTIVECGGFTLAQIVLNTSTSAISVQISALEDRLGARLCERGRKGFRLTEQGQIVYDEIQQIFAELHDFQSKVDFRQRPLSGELRLAIVDNIITNPEVELSKVISSFRQLGEDITIRLDIQAPVELEQTVLSGRYDLGIGSFYQSSPSLNYDPLFFEEQSLYCGYTHPLFQKESFDVKDKDLEGMDYIVRGYMAKMEKEKLPQCRQAAVSYHVEGVAILILSGDLIGYLPTHFAERWVSRNEMKPLLFDTHSYTSQFSLISPARQHDRPLVREFKRLLGNPAKK